MFLGFRPHRIPELVEDADDGGDGYVVAAADDGGGGQGTETPCLVETQKGETLNSMTFDQAIHYLPYPYQTIHCKPISSKRSNTQNRAQISLLFTIKTKYAGFIYDRKETSAGNSRGR
ncbi:hypothetical protein AMTR_s00001p00262360 [Amborella trichopoda]|uniref:Uncharacterized protein n=1 Tax=Amborella trichopoda TaxID=13333 RepID=W1NLT6_AMBTC|nr:hypothetical protein AMTR_s00001p00262360 [Amborella trichopoda]